MGRIRLGNLPRTRKWQQVVALLDSGGATTDQVAAATLDASKQGLEDAGHDPALAYSFWLLTQLPLSPRKSDYSEELRKLGISVANELGLLDLVGAFSDSVDAHIRRTGRRTDLGEMAQMGAAESLISTPLHLQMITLAGPRRRPSKSFCKTVHARASIAAGRAPKQPHDGIFIDQFPLKSRTKPSKDFGSRRDKLTAMP